MIRLTIRQWLILSWLLCLALPRLLFELVEAVQHALAPALVGAWWLIGPLMSALVTALVIILGLNWLIGRSVLRPLAAVQAAARRIADGQIEDRLPPSRVREVEAVAAAFAAMSDSLRAAALREAAFEQERRMLIGAVAHDLRTPLFALRGSLQGIEHGLAATPERLARYLAVCRDQAAVLEQRIQAFFAYARLEYLEQSPHRVLMAWADLVGEVVERMRPAAAARQVTITVDGPSVRLFGDGPMLGRLLENLLDNAVRHAPVGSAVTLDWGIEGGHLRFAVRDRGPGVAAEDLPHVFDPLYRGDTARRSDGVGLGLAIALRIIKAHDGTLAVANQPAGGAAFTGLIPLVADHDATEEG